MRHSPRAGAVICGHCGQNEPGIETEKAHLGAALEQIQPLQSA